MVAGVAVAAGAGPVAAPPHAAATSIATTPSPVRTIDASPATRPQMFGRNIKPLQGTIARAAQLVNVEARQLIQQLPVRRSLPRAVGPRSRGSTRRSRGRGARRSLAPAVTAEHALIEVRHPDRATGRGLDVLDAVPRVSLDCTLPSGPAATAFCSAVPSLKRQRPPAITTHSSGSRWIAGCARPSSSISMTRVEPPEITTTRARQGRWVRVSAKEAKPDLVSLPAGRPASATGAIRATASLAGPTVAETTAHPAANCSSSLAVSKAISCAGVLMTGHAYATGNVSRGGLGPA